MKIIIFYYRFLEVNVKKGRIICEINSFKICNGNFYIVK